jgi:hypothetical protein
MIRNAAQQLSVANRERKWCLFLEMIAPNPAMTLLNVGYTDGEFEFSPADNLLEKRYPTPSASRHLASRSRPSTHGVTRR